MDKQLLKAYIKVIVEEELARLLPPMLEEVIQAAVLKESATPSQTKKQAPEKKQPPELKKTLAELVQLDMSDDGETIYATGLKPNLRVPPAPEGSPVAAAVNAINKDYSQLMKSMKLT